MSDLDLTDVCDALKEEMKKAGNKSNGKKQIVHWQYCKDPNDINEAIITEDSNWEGLISAEQITSITFDTSHMCYVVFWTTAYSE